MSAYCNTWVSVGAVDVEFMDEELDGIGAAIDKDALMGIAEAIDMDALIGIADAIDMDEASCLLYWVGASGAAQAAPAASRATSMDIML